MGHWRSMLYFVMFCIHFDVFYGESMILALTYGAFALRRGAFSLGPEGVVTGLTAQLTLLVLV